MLEAVEWCKKYKRFNKDMILTKDDEINFKKADKCYFFVIKNFKKAFV